MASDLSIHASGNGPLRQAWIVVAALLAAAIFAEAVFAGVMLSGIGWGRGAHATSAGALIAATLVAGVVGLATLRRVLHGRGLALTLLALAGVLLVQTMLGKSSVAGASLMWLHVPLGVITVGLAAQAVTRARSLGRSPAT